MKIGMLWFDNDPKTQMDVKIERAVSYYQKKYGQKPNLCYVHPSMVNGGPNRAEKVEVRTNPSVLPNHFWIGINGGGSSTAA